MNDMRAFQQRADELKTLTLDDSRLQDAAARLSDVHWNSIASRHVKEHSASDCRQYFVNHLSQNALKEWSLEEKKKLRQLALSHNERQWHVIAEELGTGRPAAVCLRVYVTELRSDVGNRKR